MSKNLPAHKVIGLAASGAVSALPTNVYAILFTPGTANSTFKLTNDANGSGTAVLPLACLANGNSVFIDLSNVGPVYFDAKCYATLAGSGAAVTVWYD